MAATPAVRAGCCLAPSKEQCRRPPCPMNPDCWSADERDALLFRSRGIELLRSRSFRNADLDGGAR